MPDSTKFADQTDWPVFICYRQADGIATAELVYNALHGSTSLFTPEGYGSPPPISLYYDQSAPAVSDWTSIHAPALERSRTFIFICSPGAYSRLDDDDWVYRELDWWLEHRDGAPILITTHGDRWVPREIQKRWPKTQRLSVIEKLPNRTDATYEGIRLQLKARILEGIRDTAVQVLYQEVERERARTRQLVLQRRLLIALLIFAAASAIAAGAFYRTAILSQHSALIESAERLISQSNSLQSEHRPYAAGAVLLHALEIVSPASSDLEVAGLRANVWQRFRSLDLRSTTMLEGHLSAVQDIDVSSSGRLAVTGAGYWGSGMAAVRSEDDTVRLWDLDTNQQIAVFEGHKAAILRVRFAPDTSSVVSASQDGEIKVWDIASKTLRCEIKVGEFAVNLATVDFSRDSKTIIAVPEPATYDKAGTLLFWSARDCAKASSLDTSAPEMTVVSWADGSPRMWTENTKRRSVIAEWNPALAYSPLPHWYEVWAASLSPSGALVAVAPGDSHGVLSDCSVVLWDAATGKVVKRFVGHKNHVRAIAFNPDGSRLATGDENGLIVVWDVSTGNQIVQLEGHSGAIRAVKFASSESLLSGSTDRTFRLWRLPRSPIEKLLTGRPYKLAVTTDGRYWFESNGFGLEKRDSATDHVLSSVPTGMDGVASNSDLGLIVTETDNRISVRNAETLQVVRELKGPFGPFESVAIGGHPPVVVSAKDESIRVWDVATGSRVNRIDRRESGEIAMTPDGRTLAGGYEKNEVRFWNPLTGKVQSSFLIDEGQKSTGTRRASRIDVTIAPNGRMMFFGTDSGTVVAWDVMNQKPLATRHFELNNSEATTIDVAELRPAVTSQDMTTALVAVKNEVYVWDLISNDVVNHWSASRIVTQLAPGKNATSFVGVIDGLGMLEWEIPAHEVPADVPRDNKELDRYYELVGMQMSDPRLSDGGVVPRPIQRSEAQVSAMLDADDTSKKLLALSWIARDNKEYSRLVDKVGVLVTSPDARVRGAAVKALAKRGAFDAKQAANAIAPALGDTDTQVRVSALLSIQGFGPDASPAIPYLQSLLQTSDEFSEQLGAHLSPRDFACDALGNIGAAAKMSIPDIVRAVEAPIEPHKRPSASCVRALGEINDTRPEVMDALLWSLGNSEINMRYQAAIALGKLPVPSNYSTRTVDALTAASRQDPTSVEIARALENVRNRNDR